MERHVFVVSRREKEVVSRKRSGLYNIEEKRNEY